MTDSVLLHVAAQSHRSQSSVVTRVCSVEQQDNGEGFGVKAKMPVWQYFSFKPHALRELSNTAEGRAVDYFAEKLEVAAFSLQLFFS